MDTRREGEIEDVSEPWCWCLLWCRLICFECCYCCSDTSLATNATTRRQEVYRDATLVTLPEVCAETVTLEYCKVPRSTHLTVSLPSDKRQLCRIRLNGPADVYLSRHADMCLVAPYESPQIKTESIDLLPCAREETAHLFEIVPKRS